MNTHRYAAVGAIHNASEACFSLRAHFETVEKRIQSLKEISPLSETDMAAKDFLSGSLLPAWEKFKETTAGTISRHEFDSELDKGQQCLSPSDFGFHNAMTSAGRLYFFDFEYAGWDDPAKLICDFFHQPRIPAPIDFLEASLAQCIGDLALNEDALRQRIRVLFPVYGFKWCCILLNEFLPVGRKRRAFAGIFDIETRKAAQLLKATEAFKRIKI